MHNSKQSSTFIISKDFLLERNRSNFILYKNRSIEDNVKIKLNRSNNNWYGSSFKFYNKEKFNDENYIRIPIDVFEDGLYLTHWKYGDKVISNSMNKKLSDIFINNKVSNYNKKFYPIIRDGLNNILWIPKILNKFNSDNKNVLYAKWNN
jgi:tRNA(Ile)-lysidine synthetase-like protein